MPGQPLNSKTRTFVEPRFGYDFSGVRVHTNGKASESARAVNALAYTVGRNVVFGAGQFAPQTNEGRKLLAHELTHVVQQSRSTAAFQTSLGDSSDDAGEREAEMISRQVVDGKPVSAPRAAPASRMQRKMLNNVITDFQLGAKACVVHLHGEEKTALAVAKEIRSRRCVNLVHLDTTKRFIEFEIDVAGEKHTCEADPNRVFTAQGLQNDALQGNCPLSPKSPALPAGKRPKAADIKKAAVAELQSFVNNEWGAKISRCRSGDGSSVRSGALPLLALHNNEGLTLSKFDNVAEKGARLPDDPKNPGKKMKNPSLKAGENSSDFFFANQPGDFLKLSKSGNAFLQADPIPAGGDDGSLSVAVTGQRFINVEKEGRDHADLRDTGGKFKAHDAVYVKNYAMAAQALDVLGVPEGHCPTAANKVLSEKNPAADILDEVGRDKPAVAPDVPEKVLETDKKVLDREPAPATPPANCSLFENQAALDAEKEAWKKKIERMPMVEIVNWITGSPIPPPAAAVKEVERQRNCMTDAMTKSLTSQKLNLPKGNIIQSELRTFGNQEKIWKDKFDFKFKTSFGQISDTARLKCQGLLTAGDVEWNPNDKSGSHESCWKMLTADEKAKEILMTSSAPGVSRHHAGTDFDFGQSGKDLDNKAWTGTGNFADVYRWLAGNASRYGFFQPFNTKGGYGKGYTEERWHWSYYPVAQALFEFAQGHQMEIDKELQTHWEDKGKTREEFEFISKNWRSYLLNVETKARF